MGKAQHLHGEVLEGQQQLGLVLQQQVRLRTTEAHNDIGIFNFRIGRGALNEFIIDIDINRVEQNVEKVADFVFVLFDGVFTSHVFRTSGLVFLLYIDDRLRRWRYGRRHHLQRDILLRHGKHVTSEPV